MRKKIVFMVSILIMSLTFSNVESKSSFRSSSSSFKSSSFKTKPRSTPQNPPKQSSTPQKISKKPPTSLKQQSTFKTTNKSQEKPKAFSSNKADKQKNKLIAQQNKIAKKKYGTKASAEKAYREKLGNSNKYTSSIPPKTRPSHIPNSVVVNNTTINTSYGRFPGGSYGYGYYDPFTRAFISLAATDMICDEIALRNSGYGDWNTMTLSSTSAFIIMLSLLLIGIIIFIIFKSMNL